MIRISYDTSPDDLHCETLCPYRKFEKVGSIACSRCVDFEMDDDDNYIVDCLFDENHPILYFIKQRIFKKILSHRSKI